MVEVQSPVVVALFGELDVATIDEAVNRVRRHVVVGRPTEVDLSGVTFIDSVGIGGLIELYYAAKATGDLLIVTVPSLVARRVLEVTGLAPLLLEPSDDLD
jgi:anti-sigma B factor antagonist